MRDLRMEVHHLWPIGGERGWHIQQRKRILPSGGKVWEFNVRILGHDYHLSVLHGAETGRGKGEHDEQQKQRARGLRG